MSYLVDALKKAERERHEQRGADMRTLSAGDPEGGAGTAGSLLRWVVIALVACNLGLLLYFTLPGEGRSVDETRADVTTAAADDMAPVAASTARNPAPAPAAAPAQTAVQPRPSTPPPVADRNDRGFGSLRLSDDPLPSRGRVTYSQSPLDDSSTFSASNQENAPAMEDMGGAVPQVTINGHLYSSVPGRSFILVNGRRYHEGERLAAGPAVESIDAKGATLNYRGQRYQVRGPG
ncbi:general secretion pathway protein GspB [Salinisphaera aquimarina]|uniref:General secretion pathway protein GspB n=1 Tax=Salinisphaera aquimarina TaxID=2094031 RepID=A0ABV7EP98_9GAMM